MAREATASVIGRGLGGLSVFVLDDRLRPAPVGVRGECISRESSFRAGM